MKQFLMKQKNVSFSKNYFSILVCKIPPLRNFSTQSKVASCYDKFKYLNFEFSETSEKILNILEGLNPSKAAGIDNLVNF